MYFHLLWYDAVHDATCIPVNVYIVIHDIMLYVIHYAMYGAMHEKYMMQCLLVTHIATCTS